MRKLTEYMKIYAVMAGLLYSLGLSQALSAEQSSTNYSIPWSTFDAGGGESVSFNYVIKGSITQSATPPVHSTSLGFVLASGFWATPDSDGEGILDFMDNCTEVFNLDQRDTNGDGYGNLCDPDLNNDGVINFADLGLMKSVFFSANADADLDGNGAVNFLDLSLLKSMFFGPPGPSSLVP